MIYFALLKDYFRFSGHPWYICQKTFSKRPWVFESFELLAAFYIVKTGTILNPDIAKKGKNRVREVGEVDLWVLVILYLILFMAIDKHDQSATICK